MVFSSIEFLYFFLPIVLILYFITPQKFKNIILLLSSLFFYFYGEPKYILALLFSIIFNYYIGKQVEKHNGKIKKTILIFSMIINFGMLFYFKYYNFFLDNINSLFNMSIPFMQIIMPIGISFFTFQASSYIIDIYYGRIKSANNIIIFATYLALFPQLIAGPIVRYQTIEDELYKRKHSFELFANGVKRFIIGLSKKVLIANVLGELSRNLSMMNESTVLGNFGIAISDALQIYFDFSGYSDMAIGLGLMLGFKFLENFNYPFIADSITDFWRRWHISLSSWFKDYVYIPLGGSKVKKTRHYLNILTVWLLTGLWHGASWNFILWGIYFAVLLIIEKSFLLKHLQKHKIIAHIYTIVIVIISFVIFNNTTISQIIYFIKGMFGLNDLCFSNIHTNYYLKNYTIILAIAVIGATPLLKIMKTKLEQYTKIKVLFDFVEPIILILLLLSSTAFIVDESFNPFLYFRF